MRAYCATCDGVRTVLKEEGELRYEGEHEEVAPPTPLGVILGSDVVVRKVPHKRVGRSSVVRCALCRNVVNPVHPSRAKYQAAQNVLAKSKTKRGEDSEVTARYILIGMLAVLLGLIVLGAVAGRRNGNGPDRPRPPVNTAPRPPPVVVGTAYRIPRTCQLRGGPDDDAVHYGKIRRGTQVRLLDEQPGGKRIRFRGRTYWYVCRNY